ncbi:conserved hypothetical protein [Hyella patelloides LEGE 07179]|uniref:Uncharacterized protein n=1 Tax=Hyella patelloides LEGE 07179 TaxID=945734 RepID=A0A563VNU4_9CYAN|nr:hypothetical protein [Hyella patelloides]VEP13091.1 conserved hypothetical protein [Hyella patelloides LEGE 07179]
MKSYNPLERKLAQTLDNFPQIKQTAKTAYQYFNYWYYGDRNFTIALHPDVTIATPSQWSATIPTTEELFFGYYDKSPWSTDMTKLVYHRFRGNQLEIVVYNREQKTVNAIAKTKTWSSQQGSMVQWLDNQTIIFNDLVAGDLVARAINLGDKTEKIIPLPIQTLHPDRKEALSLNYKRLDTMRPEYGYSVTANNFASDLPYSEDGIWRVDLESGLTELIITIESLINHQPRPEMADCQHKVNHIMYSPQGSRYVFMHRWLGSQGKFSRLYNADSEGNLKLLLDDRMVSHYSWQDEEHLLAWARTEEKGDHYYLINVVTSEKQIIGQDILDIYGDGHPSFSPDRRWILTDSYPDKARQQHLLLYEMATGKSTEIASFLAPLKYSADARCDLHPRWSPDGNWVSVDATHEGYRMSYILNVSSLVNNGV